MQKTLFRIAKYALSRAASIILALSVGIFLGVLITNFGGFVDMIFHYQIDGYIYNLSLSLRQQDPPLSTDEIHDILNQAEWDLEETYGLHEPFLKRCLNWTVQAVFFNWGETNYGGFEEFGVWGEITVKEIVLECLPNSLLLFGVANLLAFFLSVFVALILSRQLGNWLDKLVIALTPIYSAPSWIIGVVLLTIFVAELKLLPSEGMRTPLAEFNNIEEILDVAKHMVLPVIAIFISVFFQGVYAWRSYFALHANEDYIEMAKAKGLSSRFIERRYLLRPSMPAIITSFAMMLITFWQGSLALEYLFHWPGIGSLFIFSLYRVERGVVMSVVVLFAYLLGGTVFLLDIIYALVDPRVKVASDNLSLDSKKSLRVRFLGWKKKLTDTRKRSRVISQPKQSISYKKKHNRTKIKLNLWKVKTFWKDFKRYPSAVIGMIMIFFLICISLYTIITVPYDEAVRMWRSVKLDYYKVPELAQPVWVNLFRKDKLPETIVLSSWEDKSIKQVNVAGNNEMKIYDLIYEFEYVNKHYPQEVYLFFDTNYSEKMPYVILTWITPDGREIELHKASMPSDKLMSLQWPIRDEWTNDFGGIGGDPLQILFGRGEGDEAIPVPGIYKLHLEGFTFEEDSDLNAELVVVGLVHGWGGTDKKGHDLMLGLLWGMPVALAFGLIGAIGTTLATMIFAAISAWFGGWLDGLIQRLTEVNIILPMLPIVMTINYLYGKTIWHILGIIVLLSIFGSGVKNYRTMFLQIKEAPYVEAAMAYGASNWRIIFKYLVPRAIPMLIPQLVILVPGYVFLEATLAFLGVSDRYIPTWGKLIEQAIFSLDALDKGYYFIVLEPLVILLVTGFSFAMLGLALERILNPRLQDS